MESEGLRLGNAWFLEEKLHFSSVLSWQDEKCGPVEPYRGSSRITECKQPLPRSEKLSRRTLSGLASAVVAENDKSKKVPGTVFVRPSMHSFRLVLRMHAANKHPYRHPNNCFPETCLERFVASPSVTPLYFQTLDRCLCAKS